MALASIVRLRRASAASATLPALVEPGELVCNTYARQLWIGDAAAGSVGVPRALLAVTFHNSSASYLVDAVVLRNGQLWRAKNAIPAKSFDAADWEQISGGSINQGVFHPTPVRTANTTAAATDWVRVDTRTNTVRVNLPASPTDGSSVRVTDVGHNFINNPCTVGRNGQLINGLAADYVMQDQRSATFLFTTGLGWSGA